MSYGRAWVMEVCVMRELTLISFGRYARTTREKFWGYNDGDSSRSCGPEFGAVTFGT